MGKDTRFVGLDVHANLIAVAVAEGGRDGEVRSHGTIENNPEAVRRLFKRLHSENRKIRVCYEAGPCGYGLYWQLTEMGIDCEVIAPTLVPKKPGERVKTDRLDAMKLARCHRAGELTSVWVPDKKREVLRDMVRAREVVRRNLTEARQVLSKLLLKHNICCPDPVGAWSQRHMAWLRTLRFDEAGMDFVFQEYFNEVEYQMGRLVRTDAAIEAAIENSPPEIREIVVALQSLRGVAKVTAAGVVAEIGYFSRFTSADQLMSYVGVVPSEYSTGGPDKRRQGGITKAGNRHVRRLVTESAWNYRFRPLPSTRMKASLKKVSPVVQAEVGRISKEAQERLCSRYRHLLQQGKNPNVTVTAVGRELLGFIWAIAVTVEKKLGKDSRVN